MSLLEEIEAVKSLGYTVHFRHHRKFHRDLSINPRGGATECILRKKGSKYTGVSRCSSGDNFNHRVGSTIALQRALLQAKFYDR